MAKFPNTTPFEGYSASFTYTYPGWNNSFANALFQKQEQTTLAELEQIDQQVDKMLTYPDAERIINTIKHKRGDSDD